jgi:DNA-nicking Smr family endonuclease
MKKRKKSENIPVKFASAPFKSLKGFQTGIKESKGRDETPITPAPLSYEADDTTVFLRAVGDVKRIHTSKPSEKERKKVALAPGSFEKEERSVFLREVEKLQLDVKFHDELPEDVTPLRPAGLNRLRELKRGAIHISLELDLHGLTRDEALVSLEKFIAGAYNRSQKAVLVITGKGNNSPEEPVLLGAVSGWLREQGKGSVAEFAPAPRQLGGSGAFVVFLKEKGKSKD